MSTYLESLLQECVDSDATDLYLTVDIPPSLRFGHRIVACKGSQGNLTEELVQGFLNTLLSEEILDEFRSTLEYNTAISWGKNARFRVNVFRQRQHSGMVLRRIRTDIPSIPDLGLSKIHADLVMEKRGLILLVGPTDSGKSTSLAAMLQHRNLNGEGHIVTIEDPIEFLLEHKNCIITQRDVGIDTYSFGVGLKNALRQTPDIIVIGEIRDRDAMEHAITFAETGHLCLATLHANNANQAIERVINFFPEEKHRQILLNLSLNLKAILSQRLVTNKEGKRTIALEILLNHGLIKTLILEGRVKEIKECIEKGRAEGMVSFDQTLFELYTSGVIAEEVAMAEADNPANLRLTITQYQMNKRIGPFQGGVPATGLGVINKQTF